MGFLKIAAQTAKPTKALEIACEKKANKGVKFTESEYEEAVSHLKKDALNKKEDGASQGDSTADALDSENSVEKSEQCEQSDDFGNPNEVSNFDNILFSQMKVVARRVNVSFDKVVEIHLSILQMQVSTLKDMGVKK